MDNYLNLVREILTDGELVPNRTGVAALTVYGVMLKFDLAQGFPILTTRQVNWKSAFAEMLGFLKGVSNNAEFERLGTKVWTQNSEAPYWTTNPNYKGPGDLGRIYGVQARDWRSFDPATNEIQAIDQLKLVVEFLNQRQDNRRLIISHWNPGELNQMALPPCHVLYQFNLANNRLHLSMYQRSCDVPLGLAFNVPGYAWLLSVIAHITGLTPGVFTHFINNAHIYENQIETAKLHIERQPNKGPKPRLWIDPLIKSLADLEQADLSSFDLLDYYPQSSLNYPFTV